MDVGMEWLSVFVEDCFSSPQSCVLLPSNVQNTTTTTTTTISTKPSNTMKRQNQNESPLQNFTIPGKARSKRKRLSAPRTNKNPLSIWSNTLNPKNELIGCDPPLLKQAYWLADSELIVPKGEKNVVEKEIVVKKEEKIEDDIVFKNENENENESENSSIPTRRCTHCLSQRTPQWRAGPLGPKTLCNACGVRYKSGRLLPEYRPAKSPTFVSYLHSNSHKKVMEMRNMSSSIPTHD